MRLEYYLAIVGIGLCMTLFSCIREEAANAEADIVACTLPDESILLRNPIIENERVTIVVRAEEDLTALAPEFDLTPGATISPESGTVRDFSDPQNPQKYTVTSEDGNWKKVYTVSFVSAEIPTEYHFENVTSDERNRYDVFYEFDYDTGTMFSFGSGNIGFALTGAATNRESYPTCSTKEGYIGKGVKLVTRKAGSFGELLGMPIAAGNIFMGTFDLSVALLPDDGALKALNLGWPFRYEPLYVSGYYKYKAGDKFINKDGDVELDKVDTWDVYAVFYEVTKEEPILNVTIVSDNFAHPNIVSVALLPDDMRVDADEWTYFEIPFKMKEGKVIDPVKLKNDAYNVAIVASSSRYGNYFRGAPGSTLYLDELRLIYKKDNEE